MKIPLSVIVVTQNEEKRIARCLAALSNFDEVIVVDSMSRDKTREIAENSGAVVVEFNWNSQYPKKRQWCLDNLHLKNQWVFFVDADEIVPSDLLKEIKTLFEKGPACDAYFVRGYHSLDGQVLRFGLNNNKIALFNRSQMKFPVVDDLDIPGMGEIEGHYQPVATAAHEPIKLGQLKTGLIHESLNDLHGWTFRHKKYARWEAGMNRKAAWPVDPKPLRQAIKGGLRRNRFRPQCIFFLCYVGLLGFLDGRRGWRYACMKMQYYKEIEALSS